MTDRLRLPGGIPPGRVLTGINRSVIGIRKAFAKMSSVVTVALRFPFSNWLRKLGAIPAAYANSS